MQITDINTLAKQIHDDDVKKGWWKKDRPCNECLILVKSEMFEALEALRKGKFADKEKAVYMYYNELDISNFLDYIKDSFQDEIADAYIRTLDLCAYFGILITEKDIPHFDLNQTLENFYVFDRATAAMYDAPTANNMMKIIGFLRSVANAYQFNLDMHIQLKLEYNRTRPYKHGKKF